MSQYGVRREPAIRKIGPDRDSFRSGLRAIRAAIHVIGGRRMGLDLGLGRLLALERVFQRGDLLLEQRRLVPGVNAFGEGLPAGTYSGRLVYQEQAATFRFIRQ